MAPGQLLGGTLAIHRRAPAGAPFALDGEFLECGDRDDVACRTLWAAVIHKAMKDMAYASAKQTQLALSPSEREKLQRIYELDAPENFFESPWFDEICRYLALSPSCIRTEILARFATQNGVHKRL